MKRLRETFARRAATDTRPWWDRLLCRIGCHDWRNMDGRCASCGHVDPLWENVRS